jgi:hypothetical protein
MRILRGLELFCKFSGDRTRNLFRISSAQSLALLQIAARRQSAARVVGILRGDTEEGVKKLALTITSPLSQPSDLLFPNHVHCLIAFDRRPCAFWRPESEARCDALFNKVVVALNDVKVKGDTDNAHRDRANPLTPEWRGDRLDALQVHHSWPGPAASRQSAVRSRFGDNIKSIVSPEESTARYIYVH